MSCPCTSGPSANASGPPLSASRVDGPPCERQSRYLTSGSAATQAALQLRAVLPLCKRPAAQHFERFSAIRAVRRLALGAALPLYERPLAAKERFARCQRISHYISGSPAKRTALCCYKERLCMYVYIYAYICICERLCRCLAEPSADFFSNRSAHTARSAGQPCHPTRLALRSTWVVYLSYAGLQVSNIWGGGFIVHRVLQSGLLLKVPRNCLLTSRPP